VKKTSKRTSASRKPSRKPRRQLAPHEAALLAFARVAKKLALRWYVFGAQAVNLHGFPRATADLDLTIDLGKHRSQTLVAALKKAGFDARFADDAFIATTRVIPVVHQPSGLPIDIVLAGPGLEKTFLDEAIEQKLGGVAIPVLSIENLIVTKLLAGRPRDKEDVRELVAIHSSIDDGKIESMLALLENALDVSDLSPLYKQLRAEATSGRKRKR
jgi:hypothetical protein